MKPSIYLDYNATTPLAPSVVEAMTSALQEQWGNPSSVHWAGRQAKQALSKARRQLASLLGCQPRELLWTSGATESNNLVLRGVLERQKAKGRQHLIVSAIEHPAVLQAAQALEQADRARKQAEQELADTNENLADLTVQNQSLLSAKRRLDQELDDLRVR